MGFQFRRAFPRGSPFLEFLDDDEQRGDEQTARQVDAEHAAENRDADGFASRGACASARTSGRTPSANVNDVIRIGRKRARAASTAESSMGFPAWRNSRATSTIRMAFLADRAISNTRPICA